MYCNIGIHYIKQSSKGLGIPHRRPTWWTTRISLTPSIGVRWMVSKLVFSRCFSTEFGVWPFCFLDKTRFQPPGVTRVPFRIERFIKQCRSEAPFFVLHKTPSQCFHKWRGKQVEMVRVQEDMLSAQYTTKEPWKVQLKAQMVPMAL